MGLFMTQFCFSYICTMQIGLTVENGFMFLRSTHYFVPVMLVLVLICTRGLGLVAFSKKLEKMSKKIEDTATGSTPNSKKTE